jgi:dolichol-phosphate mannosyltransferase
VTLSHATAALAIDASEWFTAPGLRRHVAPRHWRRLERRAEPCVRATLALLAAKGARATWFVPGALARSAPVLLRELAAAGHEVALAAEAPWPLADVPPGERAALQDRWLRDVAAIEVAIGVAVRGFRAPWPTANDAPWWRPFLRSIGLAYDATPAAADAATAADVETTYAHRLDGGGAVAVRSLPAMAFDPMPPRLAGVPAAAFRELVRAETLPALPARGGGTVLAALGTPVLTAPPRQLPPEPIVVPRGDAPRLCVVVPLKDEERGVPGLLLELRALADDLADAARVEYVLVDDGSVDRTWELLQLGVGSLPRSKAVRHERNLGVAAAIRTGVLATDSPFVASIDGDLSYDPRELRPMLALLQQGADLVTASPYHPAGGVRNVPAWRLLLSRGLSLGYRALLASPIRTWTSCCRVYRREAVAALPLANPRFLGTAEWLVRVLRRGGRVAEHPCVLEARLVGVSKMKTLRTIAGHLRLLAAVLLRIVR